MGANLASPTWSKSKILNRQDSHQEPARTAKTGDFHHNHHNRQNSQDSRVLPTQAIQSDQLSHHAPLRAAAPLRIVSCSALTPYCPPLIQGAESINQAWRCKVQSQPWLPTSKPPTTTISQGSLTTRSILTTTRSITASRTSPAPPAKMAATKRTGSHGCARAEAEALAQNTRGSPPYRRW